MEAPPHTRRISLGPVDPRSGSVRLRFRQVRHAGQSFVVRVFLEDPAADASTPTVGNDHFAGSYAMYGHGGAIALMPPGSLAPFDTLIDITRAVQKLPRPARDAEITLVVVDSHGQPLPADAFQFETASLE